MAAAASEASELITLFLLTLSLGKVCHRLFSQESGVSLLLPLLISDSVFVLSATLLSDFSSFFDLIQSLSKRVLNTYDVLYPEDAKERTKRGQK